MRAWYQYAMAALAALTLILMQLKLSHSYTSFTFGDSLVDVGNNDYLFTLSRADSPPYGIDFTPSGGKPTGRFTNGRTITDIVDEALGASSFSPPYLDPKTRRDSAISRGLNYASGSSGILDQTGTLFIGRIPLIEQVSNFADTKFHMVSIMGQQKADELIRRAIFSVTTGSNDVLNYLQPRLLTFFDQRKVSPSAFQNFLISNMTQQLKRLHDLGVRKILVVGIGPLGCIPIMRALQHVPLGKCSEKVNTLVRGYNLKLKRTLERLNQEMYPDTIFVFANPYDIVIKMILMPHRYGFENASDPCCGGFFPPFICSRGSDGNNTTSGLCQDRTKYVFWDAYHPTEAANIIIAKELLDGDDPSVISPMNIRGLQNY